MVWVQFSGRKSVIGSLTLGGIEQFQIDFPVSSWCDFGTHRGICFRPRQNFEYASWYLCGASCLAYANFPEMSGVTANISHSVSMLCLFSKHSQQPMKRQGSGRAFDRAPQAGAACMLWWS